MFVRLCRCCGVLWHRGRLHHHLPDAPPLPCFVDVSCLVPLCIIAEDQSCIKKPPGQWKVSDLDVVLSEPAEGPQADTSESLEGSGNTTSH